MSNIPHFMKMGRISIYLDDKHERLMAAMIEEINHSRRVEVDNKLKNGSIGLAKYKPITKSEFFQQLITRVNQNTRTHYIAELEKLSRLSEFYEQKLKYLNSKEFSIEVDKRAIKENG